MGLKLITKNRENDKDHLFSLDSSFHSKAECMGFYKDVSMRARILEHVVTIYLGFHGASLRVTQTEAKAMICESKLNV